MSDAAHMRGCQDEGVPSKLMDGYRFCANCRRMVADPQARRDTSTDPVAQAEGPAELPVAAA